MKVAMMYITPTLALEMLQKNTNNRRVSKERVQRYADDMEKGLWFENGESIVVTESGVIADGQHRLMAIVKANYAAKFVIVTVSDVEAKSYDVGKARSVMDMVRINGSENLKRLSPEVCKAARFIYVEKIMKKNTVSEAEITSFLESHIDLLLDFDDVIKKKCKRFSSVSVLGALLVAYKNGYPKEKLCHFYEVLSTGYSTSEKDFACISLRNYLISHIKEAGTAARADKFSKTCRALYAYDKELKTFRCSAKTKEYYIW